MRKKFLSLLLAFCLLLPYGATAARAETGEESTQKIVQDENDRLFAGYVERVMYADNRSFSTGAYIAGNRLTGSAREVYDGLRGNILRVAAGEVSSTEFTFPASSTSGSYDAISALLADYPYELFWFDKTEGWATGYNYDGTVTISMCVAAAYSASGYTGTFRTNAQAIRSVSTAAENARELVR